MPRLVALILLALVAAACTPGADPTTSSEATSSSTTLASTTSSSSTTAPPDGFGGSITVGRQDAIATLNPFAPDAFGVRFVGNLTWAMVYDIEPTTWRRVPDLVTVLPSTAGAIDVNDDGSMTVRYEIREGARWSDGVPMSGEDLAFTALAFGDLARRGVGGVDPVMASVVDADAVDRLAFITFAEPTLAFEDALWIILPRHALEGVDLVAGTDGSDWPAGGPFVVETFEPFGAVELVRNGFYGKVDDEGRQLPYLDAVTVVTTTADGLVSAEPVSPVAAFVDRRIDVVDVPLRTEEIDRAAAAPGASVELVPTPVIEHLTFQFGAERDAVNELSGNDSLGFRRAVAHAIDRPRLLDETAVPWFDAVPGVLAPVGASAWSRYPFDPGVSTLLVDEAFGDATARTAPNSQVFTTGNGEYRIRIGDALDSRFAAIGVGYEPVYQDSVIFFGETLPSGAFDIGMWAWINDGGYASTVRVMDAFEPASGSDASDLGSWVEDGGGDTATSPDGNTFAQLAEQARTTIDPQRFAELVTEMEELLADQLPIIPLFHRAAAFAWWPDVVTGIVPNGSPSGLTWNAELWRMAP